MVGDHPDLRRADHHEGVLGSILFEAGHRDDIVLMHLKHASLKYPRALQVVALVHADRGERQEAEEALRRCLKSADQRSAHHAACSEELQKFGGEGN